ncbi:MAG: VOC family protein [Chloroflexota bacterium]|nr:MAG: VOC family protein [Chloroflexota bacterium]
MNRPAIDQQVTFLGTRDLDTTAAFYEDVLKLSLVLDQGSCRIYSVAGDAFLGFCRHLPSGPESRSVILTLVSQEVDDWYAYLLASGIVVEERPVLNPTYNIYHFFLRDPDGYLIEIQQFLEPVWPAAKRVKNGDADS